MAEYQPYGYAPRRMTSTTPQTMQTPTNYSTPAPAPSYPTAPQTPYGQAGYQTPSFPGFTPTSEFAHDPLTSNFENLMNYQIPYYMQPISAGNPLAGSEDAYGQFQSTINDVLAQLRRAGPGETMAQGAYNALMSGGNVDPALAEYRAYLAQDPYTGSEWDAYQTEFMDPLARQRDQADARTMREISAQGIDPSSGIAQAKMALNRASYDQAAGQAQNQLAIQANQRREARRGAAFNASLSAEQLKKQGQASAVSAAGVAGDAWANRLQQLLGASSLANNAAESRAGASYSADRAARAEQEANFQRAMQLAGIMADLPGQRQQEALQLLQYGDPSSVLQGTGMIANQQMNQAQMANQGAANAFSGIGSMLGYFGQMFPTAGQPSGGQTGGGYTGYTGGPTIAPPGTFAPGYVGYMPGNVDWSSVGR